MKSTGQSSQMEISIDFHQEFHWISQQIPSMDHTVLLDKLVKSVLLWIHCSKEGSTITGFIQYLDKDLYQRYLDKDLYQRYLSESPMKVSILFQFSKIIQLMAIKIFKSLIENKLFIPIDHPDFKAEWIPSILYYRNVVGSTIYFTRY